MEPAVDLWDLVIEVFHSSPNLINKTKDQKTQENLSQNTDHGPQAEVAQGVGPGPLVER